MNGNGSRSDVVGKDPVEQDVSGETTSGRRVRICPDAADVLPDDVVVLLDAERLPRRRESSFRRRRSGACRQQDLSKALMESRRA
jgi:hypothetical protein